MMTIVCPFTKSKHDSGMFKFIDDLLKFIPLASHTAKEAVINQRDSNKRLDSFLSPAGFAQNVDKQEHAPGIVRRAENRKLYRSAGIEGMGVVTPSMKYFGGWFSPDGSNVRERSARVMALKRGWCSLGKFW
jgi:hypothetical protein